MKRQCQSCKSPTNDGEQKLEKFLTRSMHQAALIRLIFCVELIPVSIMLHFSSLEIGLGYYYFVLFMLKILKKRRMY